MKAQAVLQAASLSGWGVGRPKDKATDHGQGHRPHWRKMRRSLGKVIRLTPGLRYVVGAPAISHGSKGIKEVGHRRYVGGLWDEMGSWQFDLVVRNGLRPNHYLLDVGCGSLRAGVHFIPYLTTGHYLGIDKEAELIRLGIEQELGEQLYRNKTPQLLISETFEFEQFTARPHYALAQSLFTHLPAHLILDCFTKLRRVIQEEGLLHATFVASDTPQPNPRRPHDHDSFVYTRQEMEDFGTRTGWEAQYRGFTMFLYLIAPSSL